MKARKRGRGEGTIVKIKDANGTVIAYKAAIQFGWNPTTGKPVRKWVQRQHREDLDKELAKLKAKYKLGLSMSAKDETVEEFLLRWLEDEIKRNKAPLTHRGYCEKAKNYLIPLLGRIKLEDLNGQHIQRMMNAMTDRGLSPTTVKQTQRVLSSALARARKWGLTASNTAKDCSIPKQRKYKAAFLTAQQADRLLKAMSGHRFEAIFYVALMLGLRRGEVAGLQWSDFEFGPNYTSARLHVRNSLQRLPQKGLVLGDVKSDTSRRDPPVPKLCLDALLRRQMIQEDERLKAGKRWKQDENFVFTSKFGRRIVIEELTRELDAALERAGLPHVRFHDLRHSCGSLLVAKGIPIKVIQLVLGHANFAITADTYTHIHASALDTAMDTMNSIFDDSAAPVGEVKKSPSSALDVALNVAPGKTPAIN